MKTRSRKLLRFEGQIQRAYTRGIKIGGIYKQILDAGADCSLIALKKFVAKHKLFWQDPLELTPLPKKSEIKASKLSFFHGTNWWEDLTLDGKQLFTGTNYNFSSMHMPDDNTITQRTVYEAAKYMQDTTASGKLLEMARIITADVKLEIITIKGITGFMINYGKLTKCRLEQQQFKKLCRFERREKILEDVLAGKMFPIIDDWEGDRNNIVIKEFAFPNEINAAIKKYGEELAYGMFEPVPKEFLDIYTNEKLLLEGTIGLKVIRYA